MITWRAWKTACRCSRRWMTTGASPRKWACRSGRASMCSMRTRTWSSICASAARCWARHIYRHSYPHCWRSKTPIVFRAVEQFFIRIDALRAQALEAIDTVKWVPPWGRNRIYGTVESRPDWCISRQRSWGVPLPVFYGADGKPLLDAALVRKVADLVEQHGTNLWFEKDDAWWVEALGLPPGCTRRNDTLDVWIDSGVSHQAVVRKRLGVDARGCLPGGDRPAPRLVPILAHHERGAAWARRLTRPASRTASWWTRTRARRSRNPRRAPT